MLSETVQYKDFNNQLVTETLHFNITHTQLADNLELIDIYNDMERRLGGATRELTRDEVREVLEFVKKFMRLAYGVKSEDGKKHRKSDELWEDFKDSAVYDAYLWDLFQDDKKLDNFFTGVLPSELREQAEAEVARRRAAGEQIPELQAAAPSLESSETDVEDTRPAYQRENREPTHKELSAMSREEMQEAFRWKSSR